MTLSFADVDMREDGSSEEEYDENADEDFNPGNLTAEEGQYSSSEYESKSEDESRNRAVKKIKKRKSDAIEDTLDSGDEATIKERRYRKRKKDAEDLENVDDSAGEGGNILTRAQRLAATYAKKERRRNDAGTVTIDVDKVWANMNSVPIGRALVAQPTLMSDEKESDHEQEEQETGVLVHSDEMITIKRRIEYAGEVTEMEEKVPKNSKEAQKYLAEHPEADPSHAPNKANGLSSLRRPLKRPSMFEPNPLGLVKGVPVEKLRPRAPSRVDVLMAEKKAEEERQKKAQKMTTVQKSAVDWRGFVDQEGFRDELDKYGKSKRGFLAREEFLDRAAGVREQAARDARLKL